MAHPARLVIPGAPHHLVSRGNRKQAIFLTEDDYRLYCQWLRDYARARGLDVLAYCLMTNHVHLAGIPQQEDSLALAVGPTQTRYAQWVDRREGWSGHLGEGRFFSVPMDEPHAWAAIKYVELNPVRAGLVARAEDYPWSSA